MSGNLPDNGPLELTKSITADAEAQIRTLLERAQVAVEAENSKADQEAGAIRAEILAKAREKADRLSARERAMAKAEAQRAELRAREAAVSKEFDRILAELAALHSDREQYRQSLMVLAAEAIQGIAEPEVRLRLATADQSLADSAFMGIVRDELKARTNHNCTVHLSFDLVDAGGGCSAESSSRRVILDNTYTRRLERARRSLRTTIMREAAKYYE